MKKLIVSATAALMTILSVGATDVAEHNNRLYITVGEVSDLSQVPIELYLEHPNADITAMEVYLAIPEGAVLSKGNINSGICDATHELVEGTTEKGWFVSITSPELKIFANGDAPLCSWTCDMSALEEGEYNIAAVDKFAVSADENGVYCYKADDQAESIIINNGTITGIDNIANDKTTGKLIIYNLKGERQSAPLPGQINIINGRKILVK